MTWHHRTKSSFPERRRRRSSLGISLALFIGATIGARAQAEMAEEVLQHATDSASTHLFTVNPAVLAPKGLQGGVLLIRQSRKSELSPGENGGDKMQSEVQDEHQMVGLLGDLGAGAGIGVSHEILYHKAETKDASAGRGTPLTETTKTQHSKVKLLVELTSDLEVGIAIRFSIRTFRSSAIRS